MHHAARLTALAIAIGFAVGGVGCATNKQNQPAPPSPARGAPIEFSFGTTQGGLLESTGTRGRATALLFVTTFDLASQAQARQLDDVLRSHTPRANGGAVVMEAPKYAVLAEAFRTSLGLSYPVALADAATLSGGGPFGAIKGVPTLVILDRRGREVFRHTGAVAVETMRRGLERASN